MTRPLYAEDFEVYDGETRVVSLENTGDGRVVLQLEGTVFVPKGGGQPYDQGVVENDKGKMSVQEVYVDKETRTITHVGVMEKGTFSPDDEVKMHVDRERRYRNSKIHSLGHLIDEAMWSLGRTEFRPGKGYHYPDGPFVEYEGTVDDVVMVSLQADLQNKLNEIIAQNTEMHVSFVEREKLEQYCRHIGDGAPLGAKVRVVQMGTLPGMPCGGTHVKRVGELAGAIIRKVKYKKGILKISYAIA